MRPMCLLPVAASLLLSATASAQPYTFVEVAREFAEGSALGFLDPDVRTSISEDGTVVFTGFVPGNFQGSTPDRLLFGDGGPVGFVDLTGFDDVRFVQVNSAGWVVFEGIRDDGSFGQRGVYRTSTTAAAITTYYEGSLGPPMPPEPTAFSANVALSESGTVAFTTITNGAGALYRGPVTGTPSVYRQGSGTFFNNRRLDVNDSGQVVMEMEYADPTRGLSRGLLVFSAPNQTRSQISTAFEKANVGWTARMAINGSGQVAFATNLSATLTFYDPPDNPSGTVVETVTVSPGVYVSTPTGFGLPLQLTQIADGTVYANFGDVDINDAGTVVFQASPIAGGGSGVFRGNDPVADKIIQQGDVEGPFLFSIVQMGELNNAGELSVFTSDFNSTDRQIWKIQGITAPPPPPPPPAPTPPIIEFFRRVLRALLRLFGLI